MKGKLKQEIKLAAVAEMLDGSISESEAAVKYGVTQWEVVEWKAMFAAGMRYSLQSERTSLHRARSAGKMRVFVAVSLLLLLIVGGATAASVEGVFDCDPMDASFFCFQPNSPARASEINHNFAKMSVWVEGAVGPLGYENVITSETGTQIGGQLTADQLTANGATIGGSLTVDGKINGGFTLSKLYSAYTYTNTDTAVTTVMTPVSSSICFLVRVYAHGNFNSCAVHTEGADWVVTAERFSTDEVTCTAQCLTLPSGQL